MKITIGKKSIVTLGRFTCSKEETTIFIPFKTIKKKCIRIDSEDNKRKDVKKVKAKESMENRISLVIICTFFDAYES